MLLAFLHHIAIICSDYERSKKFYTEILGFTIIREVYRSERRSYKLDLALNGHYLIELFSFPHPPTRVSRPEAAGLRHIAFQVADIEDAVKELSAKGIICESIRIDEYTGRKFTFFSDPDDLPIVVVRGLIKAQYYFFYSFDRLGIFTLTRQFISILCIDHRQYNCLCMILNE